jgi:hypothetical protein
LLVLVLVLLQVIKNEGVKSLFKGAGANILRAVAGAGVLSGYDQLQVRGRGSLKKSIYTQLATRTGYICGLLQCFDHLRPGY